MLWCMGVLGVSDSVGSRRRLLCVEVVVEVVLGGLRFSVDGPRNVLKVSVVVLVVLWTN